MDVSRYLLTLLVSLLLKAFGCYYPLLKLTNEFHFVQCAAALAKIGIRRVFFGCRNDRFGGCGSLMCLHKPDFLPGASHKGYPIVTGILEREAVTLLRSFYERENFHAPDAKRKKKDTCEVNPQSTKLPATEEVSKAESPPAC